MTLFHRQTGQLRAWARRTLWCIIVIGSLCAIVIPIFSIYRKEGDNTRSVVEVPPQGVSHTGDYIHVLGSVASVDFEDKNFRVHFEFTPHGTLAGDDGVLTAAIAVSLFYTTLTFPESQIMRSVDVTMPYTQGATIDYPFDAYKSYFEILANKDKERLHKIPISLTFLGKLQSVEFIPTVQVETDDLYKIAIEIFTRRSPTTIGFSLFIVLIMWMLSIAIGIIAIQVIRKYRVSDEHVLTLGITTLFALPALRETQPGIPSIGCAADVLGFYWNMAIIAISSIMILMASALRWKEPSIEREIELVHKQHDFQSKLISEMAIPMPFPITGSPFSDYQVKKKRIPFMMSHRHRYPRQGDGRDEGFGSKSMRSSLRSPPYSEGGHEYHHEPSQEGYFFTENPNHQEIILLRQHHQQQQQQQKHKQQQEEEEEYWRTKDVFGVEQPQLQDLVPNGSVEEGLQEQQQQCQNRTSVCLSVAASSTTASTSTATSSLSISPRNNETPPTQHTFTGRYHHRHNPIPTATSPSFSSSHCLHPEQQIQALEIHRAVLDQSVSDENQNAILSIPSSSLPRTISPIPWNSTSPATPRWIYDVPPSYHMPVPPLPLLPISLPLLPARGPGVGAGAGSRTGSSRRAAEMQHAYHYQNSSSSSTSTSTSTTIQHTLLRL